MKAIRNIIFCVLLSVLATGLAARDRVVEKSGKTPDWLMTSGRDGFSVFARADDISSARDKCLEDIRQYIVNSIAANITSVETSTTDLHNRDGIETLYTTYNSELKTAAAKLPLPPLIIYGKRISPFGEANPAFSCLDVNPLLPFFRRLQAAISINCDAAKTGIF